MNRANRAEIALGVLFAGFGGVPVPPVTLPSNVTRASPERNDVQRARAGGEAEFASVLRASMPQTVPANVTEVARTPTPLSAKEATEALASAYRRRFGTEPTESTLTVLTAHWAHETGHGRSMVGFNFGGIKGVGPSGLTVACKTREGFGAGERRIVDRFRAYQSADEGANDYLGLLARRYPVALERADAGDAVGFAHALGRAGYYTASPDAYARSIASIAAALRPDLADAPSPPLVSRGREWAPQVATAIDLPPPSTTSPPFAFIDTLAFADELARVATRIATPTPEEDDDPAHVRATAS